MKSLFFGALFVAGVLFSSLSAAEHHHEMIKEQASQNQEEKTIHATGKIKFIAENHLSVKIFHDPITQLNWPSMNMPFAIAQHELVHGLKVGDRVSFEFIQKEDKNIITKIEK